MADDIVFDLLHSEIINFTLEQSKESEKKVNYLLSDLSIYYIYKFIIHNIYILGEDQPIINMFSGSGFVWC